MNKKITAILSAFILTIGFIVAPMPAEAASNTANTLLQEALKEKTFYHYNMAYYEINKLSNETEKTALLGKLSTIGTEVWTKDIKAINARIDEMVKTASGKTYDELEAQINKSDLHYLDRHYLLGELTSWGRQLVWTPDYKVGVQSIIDAWTNMNYTNIEKAQAEIDKVANQYSKNYLLIELDSIRNSYYNNEATFAKTINDIANNNSLSEQDRAIEINYMLWHSELVGVPIQYLQGNEYAILYTLIRTIGLDSNKDLQQQIDTFVVCGEAAKFEGNIASGNSIKVEANTAAAEIDVTDQFKKLLMPLLPVTKYNFKTADFNPITNLTVKSQYLEVRDGKIYLKAKAVGNQPAMEYITYDVTFNTVTVTTSIAVSLVGSTK